MNKGRTAYSHSARIVPPLKTKAVLRRCGVRKWELGDNREVGAGRVDSLCLRCWSGSAERARRRSRPGRSRIRPPSSACRRLRRRSGRRLRLLRRISRRLHRHRSTTRLRPGRLRRRSWPRGGLLSRPRRPSAPRLCGGKRVSSESGAPPGWPQRSGVRPERGSAQRPSNSRPRAELRRRSPGRARAARHSTSTSRSSRCWRSRPSVRSSSSASGSSRRLRSRARACPRSSRSTTATSRSSAASP